MIGAAMIGRRQLAYSIGLFAILFSLTDDDRTVARLYAIEAVLWFILAAVIESREAVVRLDIRRDVDPKGGDPSEWPADLRVRQMPEVTR